MLNIGRRRLDLKGIEGEHTTEVVTPDDCEAWDHSPSKRTRASHGTCASRIGPPST
jgi:hypothetical protein